MRLGRGDVTRDGEGTCPYQERLPALMNGHLGATEAAALREHVRTCPACRTDAAVLRQLAATLRRLPPLSAPLGLRERILAAAETTAGDRRTAGNPVDAEGRRSGRGEAVPSALPAARHPQGRISAGAWRLAAVTLLLVALGLGGHTYSSRYRWRAAGAWLQAARETADRCYYLHVEGWVRTPGGVVPVEGWRLAGDLTTRVGSGARARREAGRPHARLATWGGAAGRFTFGEPLLFANGPEPRPAGPPRFYSRSPLVIALPRAGGLEQRVWIDPVSEQVLRAQLIGPDGQPRAALERLEYNVFPTPDPHFGGQTN